ncbi:hypothetical protein B0H10DRAFT_1154899 [Mycena sp. CBHHK59/15]|nr:hypothetical protein B0H10DRAFT_1154899 [Mycena sp. CBHHK59/15]
MVLTAPLDAISIVMVSTPVQLFTAWRISVITGSIVPTLLISVLSIASFGGGLLVTVFVSIRTEFAQFQSFRGAVVLWLVCSAVCDVFITGMLTYSLYTRKTGLAVDGQINRIIRLTVQTGAITALAALADVLLFLAFPDTTLQFIPDFPLSKLYTIALVSTLNARVRGRAEDAEQRLPNALFNESQSQSLSLNTLRSPMGCCRSEARRRVPRPRRRWWQRTLLWRATVLRRSITADRSPATYGPSANSQRRSRRGSDKLKTRQRLFFLCVSMYF